MPTPREIEQKAQQDFWAAQDRVKALTTEVEEADAAVQKATAVTKDGGQLTTGPTLLSKGMLAVRDQEAGAVHAAQQILDGKITELQEANQKLDEADRTYHNAIVASRQTGAIEHTGPAQ